MENPIVSTNFCQGFSDYSVNDRDDGFDFSLSPKKPKYYYWNDLFFADTPEFLKRLDAFIEVDFGDDVVFDCKVVSVSKTKITWYHDEQDITENPRYRISEHGDGVYSLVIPNATKFDEGPYKVRATNFEGSSASTGYLEVSGDSSVTPLSRQPRRNSEHAISQPPPLPGIVEQITIEEIEALAYDRDTPVWIRKSYRQNHNDSNTEDDYSDVESDTSVESQDESCITHLENNSICQESEISKTHNWFNSPIKKNVESENDNISTENNISDTSSKLKVNPLKAHTSCEFENVQNMLHEAIADISQQEASIEKDKQIMKDSENWYGIKCESNSSIPDLLEGINESLKIAENQNNMKKTSLPNMNNNISSSEKQDCSKENIVDNDCIKKSNDNHVDLIVNVPAKCVNQAYENVSSNNQKISKATSLLHLIEDFSNFFLFLDKASFPLLYYIFFVIVCAFMGTWKQTSPSKFILIIYVFSTLSFIYSSIYANYNNCHRKKKKQRR